ncbi:MAG: hypothetical protein HZB53_18450 [Chloroflexi bacterium]|nr:hypothetical protein [Chloroflexota bacterium]
MDVILEDCLEAIRSGQSTVRDCLAKYPAQAEALEALLAVAQAIETVPDVTARAAFKAELRGRIQNLPAPRAGLIAHVNAAMMELAKPRYRWATAIVAAALLLLSATTYAAELSLPGDALYPVKRAAERIELALPNDPASRTRILMARADRRLSEAETLATTGQTQLAEQAVSEYGNAVNEAIAALESRPGQESRLLAQALHDRLARQQAHLRALAEQVPAPSASAIRRALTLSQAASERLLTFPTPEPTGQPVTQPATAPKTPAPGLTPPGPTVSPTLPERTLPVQTPTPPASLPLPPGIPVPTVAPTVSVPTLPVKTPTPPAAIPLPPTIHLPTVVPTVIVPTLPLPGITPPLPLPTVKPP